MSNQYVNINSFRQNIVNKRVDPPYKDLSEKLIEFKVFKVQDNQVVQWYTILNECIYNNDESNFISITYTSGSQTNELTKDSDYFLDATSAVITFAENLDPKSYTNLTANYKGGGSIIWAEDVTDLQKVITTIDSNAIYSNGSNPMTNDLLLGSGTSENPFHDIINVNLVDGIKVSRHNHTGVQASGIDAGKDYGAPIPEAGIENNAVTEIKIKDGSVTNSKLSINSVNNDKIQDNTITANKFNNISVGSGLKRVPTSIDGITVNNAVIQTNIDNTTITYTNNGVMQIPGIINLTGVVLPFAGSGTSIPAGWLLCDGKAYPTALYQRLYQVIGNTYGGDNLTFNVPNFIGKTFWGGINNDGIANQEIAAGLPNIKGLHGGHDANTTTVEGAFSYERSSTAGTGSGSGWIARFDASKGEVHTDNNNEIYRNDVYGKSDTVQPPAIRMKFIIKT